MQGEQHEINLKSGRIKPTQETGLKDDFIDSLNQVGERDRREITRRSAVEILLKSIDEDWQREGLKNTPKRFCQSLAHLTSGYEQEPEDIINRALFKSENNDMILVRDIEVYSLCEHHMIPFFGVCHVAYLPDKKIVGLSKIPRLVNLFARRLQVQERLTSQICETLFECVQPKGVAVMLECHHLCMMMRGVEKQQSKTISTRFVGDMAVDPYRQEFFRCLKG